MQVGIGELHLSSKDFWGLTLIEMQNVIKHKYPVKGSTKHNIKFSKKQLDETIEKYGKTRVLNNGN